MFDLIRYQAADGREPFTDWLNTLRDRQAKARILARIVRKFAEPLERITQEANRLHAKLYRFGYRLTSDAKHRQRDPASVR